MTTVRLVRVVVVLLVAFSIRTFLEARQQTRAVTASVYARAEKMLPQNLNGLVAGGVVTPTWLPDERFWYRTTAANGSSQIILVDPVKRTRQVCSAEVEGCRGTGNDDNPSQKGGARSGRGGGGGRGGAGISSSDGRPVSISPDGRRAVFIREWNLWLRDMESGQ